MNGILFANDAETVVRSVTESAWFRATLIAVIGTLLLIAIRWGLGRVIRRLTDASPPVSDSGALVGSSGGRATVTLGDVPTDLARVRRIHTLHQLLSSTLTVVAVVVITTMVLAEFNVNVAPLLASAGVVGVALAFGAQSLVSDLLAGLFMLIENQYNVGDRVELGALGNTLASGTVEEVGLRVTTIRDDEGRLWYVRNGQILRVGNESQGWSLAVLDVALAPDTDISAVRDAVEELVENTLREEALTSIVLPDREATVRVADISATSAVLQVRVHAQPGQNHRLASILRRRLYDEFKRTGIKLA